MGREKAYLGMDGSESRVHRAKVRKQLAKREENTVISRGIAKARGMGRLWPCLLAMTIFPGSYLLLAHDAYGDTQRGRDAGTVPISIGKLHHQPAQCSSPGPR